MTNAKHISVDFTNQFIKALKALEGIKTDDHLSVRHNAFYRFYKEFGTHFFVESRFGGKLVISTEYSKSEVIFFSQAIHSDLIYFTHPYRPSILLEVEGIPSSKVLQLNFTISFLFEFVLRLAMTKAKNKICAKLPLTNSSSCLAWTNFRLSHLT